MTVFRRGVETVFDDVEIKAAQIDDAEVVHLLVDKMKLIVAIGSLDLGLQFARPLERPAIKCHQLLHWHGGRPVKFV